MKSLRKAKNTGFLVVQWMICNYFLDWKVICLCNIMTVIKFMTNCPRYLFPLKYWHEFEYLKIMWVLYDGSFSDQTTEYIERLAYLHFLAFLSYIIQQMFWGFLSVKYNDSNGSKENRVEIICMPWWSSRVRSLWVRMSSSTHVVEKFACTTVWPKSTTENRG